MEFHVPVLCPSLLSFFHDRMGWDVGWIVDGFHAPTQTTHRRKVFCVFFLVFAFFHPSQHNKKDKPTSTKTHNTHKSRTQTQTHSTFVSTSLCFFFPFFLHTFALFTFLDYCYFRRYYSALCLDGKPTQIDLFVFFSALLLFPLRFWEFPMPRSSSAFRRWSEVANSELEKIEGSPSLRDEIHKSKPTPLCNPFILASEL